jgi:hypothetical protein
MAFRMIVRFTRTLPLRHYSSSPRESDGRPAMRSRGKSSIRGKETTLNYLRDNVIHN